MSSLARAMAPMVNMCSASEPGKTVITITLSRETTLYEMLSDAYEYAREQCWDEESEEDADEQRAGLARPTSGEKA